MFPKLIPFAVLVLLFACNRSGNSGITKNTDTVPAKVEGADEYGMKKYFLVLLHKGPNREKHDSAQKAQIQKAHLENIQRLADAGKIVLAGPFLDNWKTRGIFVFNAKDSAEVSSLLNSDEAVKTGRLTPEIHSWYGSAALVELNALHKKYEKKKVQ